MNNLWSAHPNIIYFPIFYLDQLNRKNYQNYNKEYRISFLSNVARFHRVYFYYKVRHSINHATDCFSVRGITSAERLFYQTNMKHIIGKYDTEIEKNIPFATPSASTCNEINNTLNKKIIDNTNQHTAYNSYINVVGESDISIGKVFLTEKTWKAVRSRCIPVFFDPAFNVVLKKVGFNFDNEVNAVKLNYLNKIEHLNNFMSTRTLLDVEKIYTSQQSTIEQNVNYFYSDALKKMFAQHLRDKLKL